MAVVENWGGPGADPADAVQAQRQVVLQDVLLDHDLCWLLELLHQIQIVCTIWDSCFLLCRILLSHHTEGTQISVHQGVCQENGAVTATTLQLVQCAKNRLLAVLMCSMAFGGSTVSIQGMTTSLAACLKHSRQQQPSTSNIAAIMVCTGRKITSWAESTIAGCGASLCLMPLGCSPWRTVFQCLMYLVLVLFQHLQHHR